MFANLKIQQIKLFKRPSLRLQEDLGAGVGGRGGNQQLGSRISNSSICLDHNAKSAAVKRSQDAIKQVFTFT